MDLIDINEEPEWLEKPVFGELRVWHVIFLCIGGVTTLIVMVCCCVRFRIPRTKQQIEADYQRRKITTKFSEQLKTIEDNEMEAMSLDDALELLYEKKKAMEEQHRARESARQKTDPPAPAESTQKADPQAAMSFVKFASKVATLSKLGGNKPPTSPIPTTSGARVDF